MGGYFRRTPLMFLNFLKNHALVKEGDELLLWKEKGRGKDRLLLAVLVRMNASRPSFILTGTVLGSLRVPARAPLPALGVESEGAQSYLSDWTPFLSEPTYVFFLSTGITSTWPPLSFLMTPACTAALQMLEV